MTTPDEVSQHNWTFCSAHHLSTIFYLSNFIS